MRTAALLASFVVLAAAPRAWAQETPPEAPQPGLAPPGPAAVDTAPASPIPPASPPPAEAPAGAAPGPPRPWRYTGTLGVVSLPRVLSLDAVARFRRKDDPRWDVFAVGAGIDYLPPGLANFDTTKFSWMMAGADGRWFPWRWLFVGARIGWQFSRADASKFGSDVTYVTSAFVLAPKIGALYTLPSGVTLGGELGATVPIGATTSQSVEDASDSNARAVAKTFGMFVMPFVSLRVGYTL